MLRLFVNTFTVNYGHYLINRDNLAEPIEMQSSEKQKTFSHFYFAFLICILNFQHLPTKDYPRS